MPVWTHNVCWSCWAAKNGSREPVRMRNPKTATCCYCGIETGSGITVRDVEENTPFCKDKNNAS